MDAHRSNYLFRFGLICRYAVHKWNLSIFKKIMNIAVYTVYNVAMPHLVITSQTDGTEGSYMLL